MLNYEYKILKYINKHPDITYPDLKSRFSKMDIDNVIGFLGTYIYITDVTPVIDEFSNDTGQKERDDKSTIHISHLGNEYIEHKQREFWAFFFPYAITTVVAITSIAVSMR